MNEWESHKGKKAKTVLSKRSKLSGYSKICEVIPHII